MVSISAIAGRLRDRAEPGRELKAVLIVLNLKQFLRTPIELPSNLTRN